MPRSSLCVRALLLTLLLCSAAASAGVADEVQALIARGDAAGALRRAEAATRANPADPQSRFMHAVALMELQRHDEALAAFTRLSQEYPELPEPHNNIALLHARAGQLELARQALQAALRNDPGHRAARANLGEVHLMLAVQAWEQAASSGPLDPRLMRRLEAARALVAAAGSGVATGR
jgi:Flp pilus assembly protein TadD